MASITAPQSQTATLLLLSSGFRAGRLLWFRLRSRLRLRQGWFLGEIEFNFTEVFFELLYRVYQYRRHSLSL